MGQPSYFSLLILTKQHDSRAVVVEQLAERVVSDIRDPWFESQHQQSFKNVFICELQFKRDKNKEKEAGNGPFIKKQQDSNPDL